MLSADDPGREYPALYSNDVNLGLLRVIADLNTRIARPETDAATIRLYYNASIHVGISFPHRIRYGPTIKPCRRPVSDRERAKALFPTARAAHRHRCRRHHVRQRLLRLNVQGTHMGVGGVGRTGTLEDGGGIHGGACLGMGLGALEENWIQA